jgi:hypothetical protein
MSVVDAHLVLQAAATGSASAADWLAAAAAPISILVAVGLAAGTFWRRPNLSLHNRVTEWRIERNQEDAPVPSIRLVAENGRLHRAAKRTLVLVEHYRETGSTIRVPLGSVALGWTSSADAVDGGVLLFPGGARAVDLGVFQGGMHEWDFALAPNFGPFDGRNVLRARPNGYIIGVIVGSDDGRARRYEVHLNWNPTKTLENNQWNVVELLESVSLAVLPAD